MNTNAAWIFTFLSIIRLAFFVVAIIFAIVNRKKSQRAAVFLIVGLLLTALSAIGMMIIPILLQQVILQYSHDLYMTLNAILSMVSLFGFALIVFAVFVDRQAKPISPGPDTQEEPRELSSDHENFNPYQPSRRT